MKKNVKVFIDIDNTIYDSTKAVVDELNKRYNKNVNPEDIKAYDFTDQFPEVKQSEIKEIFSNENFYKRLDCIDGTAFMFIDILSIQQKIDVSFVTLGTKENLENKKEWLDYVLKSGEFFDHEVDYYEYYGNLSGDSNKSFIDMSGGIFIDDNIDCLRSSNASIKILIKNGVDTKWNNVEPGDDVYIADDWGDIIRIVEFFINNKEMIA